MPRSFGQRRSDVELQAAHFDGTARAHIYWGRANLPAPGYLKANGIRPAGVTQVDRYAHDDSQPDRAHKHHRQDRRQPPRYSVRSPHHQEPPLYCSAVEEWQAIRHPPEYDSWRVMNRMNVLGSCTARPTGKFASLSPPEGSVPASPLIAVATASTTRYPPTRTLRFLLHPPASQLGYVHPPLCSPTARQHHA